MRLKVVNPNTSAAMTEGIGQAARSVARAGTEIVAVRPEFGPSTIESYYDAHLAAPGIIDEVVKGEAESIDAFVIAGFLDPALQACREATSRPVVGAGEAALDVASMLAARYAIVTVLPRVRVQIEEMVRAYGCEGKVTSVRTTPLSVHEIAADPTGTAETLGAEAKRAKAEDGAEAIVLGCAGFADFALELEAELEMPVLDGVVCAVKLAEALVELGKRTSKTLTYRVPEAKPFTGILERFGNSEPE
ncbi:MAG: aspartate/glutamate racemase family protein [Alphaproteobacteria bacterium]|jgi:allantoin racemase|nr:aspartate/glutamate racemase family protein [Alphaproteobacteria bacterium]